MYFFTIEDYDESKPENNVISLIRDDESLVISGQVPGTAKVTVREGSNTGTVIGTMNVKVYLPLCEDIVLESNEVTTYVGDVLFLVYFALEPYDTTDIVTIETDAPEILKVEYDEYQGWVYNPLKAGTANVTIKCGDKTAVCEVTIVEEEEEMW